MPDSNKVKINIPAVAELVSVVRLAVSGVASRMDFSIEDIEDIKIAVSEACTNVVQHAYGENGTGEVEIISAMLPDKLEITVKDSGKGFDASILDNGQSHNTTREIGLGLGLTFIKNLMDEAHVTSDPSSGTTVVMTKLKPLT